ncbi:MAG: fluoride efflux transporter CrcB [Chloroflexaceae bacterium]|nr:fluoride efflux transporter CrcB [Chloroflexaceae bacterium]NJO05302.1 fluoride efflux transporter CrcB [Chloroflexaceae bacterium]
MTLLSLSVGAALGATLRYYTSLWAVARFGPSFPWGTLIVNIVGSIILGFVLSLATAPGERALLSPTLRVLLATGFCGSLTTFSTFSYEAVVLMQEGRNLFAVLYMAGSMLFGLLGVLLGLLLARLVLR